jgi:TfoX/Sxy family transcriptional regulator of competence genes
MAYDEELADRIRDALGHRDDVEERKMFGGLAFMVAGHMAVGIVGAELMVRLGEEKADGALAEEHVRPMDFTGRPMRTMVYVAAEGFAHRPALEGWVRRGVTFAESLPPKS